ncbi:MAG: MORN repeat-containing protein [Candidatus Omnitrophica bacterium]|nr:MORN repeat-containing protein [Candidatus Omnitrophota bacterium]
MPILTPSHITFWQCGPARALCWIPKTKDSVLINLNKYVGEFVDGKFTGRGTFTCSNGKQFTGNLENKVPLEFTMIKRE